MRQMDPGTTSLTADRGMPGAAASPVGETCDVLVLGGGPGGAATAAWLAEAGLRVVLVERDRHPRFHIGESLLPHSLPLLDRLGVLERVRAIGVEKPGAAFVSPDGSHEVVFRFARALTAGPDHAFQVRRQDFDALLFARAAELGAVALQETHARIVSCADDGAVVELRSGDALWTIRAGFLVDASGRSTVTARLWGEKRNDPRNSSAAIFGHFRGIPRALGPDGGNIRIHLTEPGWMWQIPLRDGVTSVGLVAPGDYLARRTGSLEDFFDDHAGRHPEMARLLASAEPQGALQGTGNFSYRSTRAAGPSHVKVGDAYGFLDPIFSTGVHLALTSAAEAAAMILEANARPRARARLTSAYDRRVRRRLGYVSWFVYRINEPAFREMLLHPRDLLGVEAAVIALLAGDFREDVRIRARIQVFKLLRYLVDLTQARRRLEYA